MVRKAIAIATVLFLGPPFASAEERFGVAVHPGAKYDDGTSKALKDAMHVEAACFRTGDSVAKVVEFYKKQGLNLLGPATNEGAMFRSGKVDVTIQNPWMNMKTGAMMKDTLVSIVRQPEGGGKSEGQHREPSNEGPPDGLERENGAEPDSPDSK